MEVYNDYNSNLTNLFCCVKDRTLALLKELGFLPLNARDDFDVLLKFFSKDEFTDDYLKEELELTQVYLKPLERESIQKLLLERSPRGDIRRAADYFKLIRYSFSGGGKAFAGKPCDIRRFFYLIWECSRRLANVIIENKDFESLIQQYDRENAFFYPNLAGQDTQYIPKTIEEDGRTLTLQTVNWQTDNTANMDGYAVGDRFTAVATYTGTATSSYVKGYTVTADYTGTVSRIALNKVRYVAIFEGTPLEPILPTEDESTGPAQFNWLAIAVPFGIVALVGAGTGAALFMKRRHETTEEESE